MKITAIGVDLAMNGTLPIVALMRTLLFFVDEIRNF